MRDGEYDDTGSDAAAMVIMLYERLAARYIADRSHALMERPWLDRFVAAVPSPFRVLDLGCGAGSPIGRYLVEQGCTLTGLDSSPTLISHCRKHLPDQTWLVGDMRLLSLDRRFEGIVAWDSLFHLSHADQRLMFAVFAEHASPGAALMFTSGSSHGTSIGTYHDRPIYHASLNTAEYEDLLVEHGFQVLAHVIADADCGDHTVWVARRSR
jgi:trans-aconitate methyltransferase